MGEATAGPNAGGRKRGPEFESRGGGELGEEEASNAKYLPQRQGRACPRPCPLWPLWGAGGIAALASHDDSTQSRYVRSPEVACGCLWILSSFHDLTSAHFVDL